MTENGQTMAADLQIWMININLEPAGIRKKLNLRCYINMKRCTTLGYEGLTVGWLQTQHFCFPVGNGIGLCHLIGVNRYKGEISGEPTWLSPQPVTDLDCRATGRALPLARYCFSLQNCPEPVFSRLDIDQSGHSWPQCLQSLSSVVYFIPLVSVCHWFLC
ncbi:hypothetical protein GJAV_G00179000 [Gymnothorax javanicus]|nr:hypothetical protein GJAV_G00179000 [Gymnothorax javanicus]